MSAIGDAGERRPDDRDPSERDAATLEAASPLGALSRIRTAAFATPPSGRNRTARCLVLASAVAAVLGLSILVATDRVPSNGAGYLLLGVHDWVVLPAVGWLWTAPGLWIAALWIPVFALLFLAALDWAVGAATLSAMQTRLIRKALRHPTGRASLAFWHRIAGGGRFRARYLEEIAIGRADVLSDRFIEARLNHREPVDQPFAEILFGARLRSRYADPETRVRAAQRLMVVMTVSGRPPSPEGATRGEAPSLMSMADLAQTMLPETPTEHGPVAQEGAPWRFDLMASERAALSAIAMLTAFQSRALTPHAATAAARDIRIARKALALLTSDIERGRPSGRAEILAPDQTVGGGTALALSLTAVAMGAVLNSDLQPEATALFEELDRFRVAAACRRATTDGPLDEKIESLIAAYGVAERSGGLEEVRAALEQAVLSAENDLSETARQICALDQLTESPVLVVRGGVVPWSWGEERGGRS